MERDPAPRGLGPAGQALGRGPGEAPGGCSEAGSRCRPGGAGEAASPGAAQEAGAPGGNPERREGSGCGAAGEEAAGAPPRSPATRSWWPHS